MQLGIVGKSNTGKSTLFSAATLVDVEISNRIFTTIEPNVGISHIRVDCPCKELDIKCSPNNSKCANGQRFVPVKLVDIAGLVPGAHEGRGLGNKFLSDIMETHGLIHIVDISGTTDDDGNPTDNHDPEKDIEFLEKEIDYWILGILKNSWGKIKRRSGKLHEAIYGQLSGLGVDEATVKELVEKHNIGDDFDKEKILPMIKELREQNKPILIAGNKIDKNSSYYQQLKDSYEIIPCCAEAELALRKAADSQLVSYLPGDSSFEIVGELSEKQKKAMNFVQKILDKYSSTGVQEAINKMVFDVLEMIVVYPVENENKFSDGKGNILPDALLLKKGSTARDLAYAVHEDIGRGFITATDCRTGKQIGANKELRNGDIVSIKSSN